MYDFDQLHPKREFINGRSVAYWIGALRGDLPAKYSTARDLAAAMSLHYDVEEHAGDSDQIRSSPDLIFDLFMPVAPVTLAESWSPVPLLCELLGTPKHHDLDQKYDRGRAALTVFESTFLGEGDYNPKHEHDAHCFRLLRYACSRALEVEGDVLLVVKQGWSYSHWKKSGAVSEDIALIMRSVGYVYVDRIARAKA